MDPGVREEVTILVFTQMGICVLGTFLNNIAFITLKDLPGLKASTYNVLLCHLTFVNLLVCTVVKPFAAIYVGYAHAIGKYQVGLEFCLIYTMISSSSLCILPWTLFLLSWHLYQAGIRATRRALGVPENVTYVFRNFVPLARVIIESEVTSMRSVVSEIDGRPSAHQKRVQIKAKMMEDGPRQRQSTVLICLWIGAGLLAATKYLREQTGQFPRVSRDYKLRAFNYTTIVTRDVDITFCKVWGMQPGLFDMFFTLVVIVLPLVLGPVLITFLEVFQYAKNCSSKSPPSEPSNRGRQLCLVYVLSSLSIGSYLANLYLVEGFIFAMYKLKVFHLLLLKYVVGYADLIFVPIVIIMLDPDVRGGVGEVYRSKRARREQAESSIF